ncbi:hypothetical protein [Succinimonas amylolytica]
MNSISDAPVQGNNDAALAAGRHRRGVKKTVAENLPGRTVDPKLSDRV